MNGTCNVMAFFFLSSTTAYTNAPFPTKLSVDNYSSSGHLVSFCKFSVALENVVEPNSNMDGGNDIESLSQRKNNARHTSLSSSFSVADTMLNAFSRFSSDDEFRANFLNCFTPH